MSDNVTMDAFRLAELERRMARAESWREGAMATLGRVVERLARIERELADESGIKVMRRELTDMRNLIDHFTGKVAKLAPPERQGYSQK